MANSRNIQNFFERWAPTRDLYHSFNFGSALLSAVEADKPEVVVALLRSGARHGWRNWETGDTAIHVAAIRSDTGMLKLLLDSGVNPFSENKNGDTPLHLAVEHNKAYAAALLTIAGRNFFFENNNRNKLSDVKNKQGEVPIFKAIKEQKSLCAKAILDPEKYYSRKVKSKIEPILFWLLTAAKHDECFIAKVPYDVLKMIIYFSFPDQDPVFIDVDNARKKYVNDKPLITLRTNSRIELRRKKEQELSDRGYIQSVCDYVEDYIYSELLQNRPFQSGVALNLIGFLMGYLEGSESVTERAQKIKESITQFTIQNGARKSRALTMLIKHKLFRPTQQAVLVSELEDADFSVTFKSPDLFERAKKQEVNKNFSRAANDYCAFILLDRENWKAQEEALKSLHAMGSKILGENLCPALVVKALVKIMRTQVVERPMMDALLESLGLEAFFSKDPFTSREPTFFGSFFSTKPPYSIVTAVAYVRIAALDAQDLEEMRVRLENGPGNKIDEILLRVAGEFLTAIQAGQASCLKFLINESFREQIEALQALVITPEVIAGSRLSIL